MAQAEDHEDTQIPVVSFGWLVDHVLRLPRPVIAWPGTDLWRVVVHGHGFILETENPAEPITGFFASYFVRARTRREAVEVALRTARERWTDTIGTLAMGDLEVDADLVEEAEGRFRWRSGTGYAFYSGD